MSVIINGETGINLGGTAIDNVSSTELDKLNGVTGAVQTQIDGKVTKVTSTDNAIVRFDGTTGQVQNSGVVIDDSSNVGIGVTPSAWSSHMKAIQTIGGSLYSDMGGKNIIMGQNFYYDGTNNKYITSNPSTYYQHNLGVHTWGIAPSGTAGNTVTHTTAMTLGSNGNLLVGTTTDNGVNKLQVNGSISSTGDKRSIPINVSTTNVTLLTGLSTNAVGYLAFVSYWNTSTGIQGSTLLMVSGAGITVISNADASGCGVSFSSSNNGNLVMKTTSGTVQAIARVIQ